MCEFHAKASEFLARRRASRDLVTFDLGGHGACRDASLRAPSVYQV